MFYAELKNKAPNISIQDNQLGLKKQNRYDAVTDGIFSTLLNMEVCFP